LRIEAEKAYQERDKLASELKRKTQELNLAQTTSNDLLKKLEAVRLEKKQLKRDLESEKENRSDFIDEMESKHRSKYTQLKQLVNQYRQ